MELNELSIKLASFETEGVSFESFLIANPGEQDVLQVIVDGNDELPIFVTQTQEQLLCISYLFAEDEVKAEMRHELNETLLRLNVPIPLSAFAKIDDKYAIFGALAVSSSFDEITHELVTLADNAIDALEAVTIYLND
ncbi:YjfI family protein [Pseudoalteromonas mariniglutinosa]|uniref:YjfI family protein n=1 Tax=Pseudoalteromonas mariniglutinosa TaxID=206042 RepID=UPI00384B97A4